MKKIYDQYYYASAPELFDKRTTGFGIFGSSTEGTEITYKRMESFASSLAPMPRIELKTPIEYIFYREEENRFIVGGATSYESYIENDKRVVSWVHIYVPKTKEEESFVDCLAINEYDTVRKENRKIHLEQVEIDIPENCEFYKDYSIPFWGESKVENQKATVFLLSKVLNIIFRDNDYHLFFYHSSLCQKREAELTDEDFQVYKKLMRNIMSFIYELTPGLRTKISCISPVVDRYFETKPKKPRGGKFQFGINSNISSIEGRIAIDLAKYQGLEKTDFLSSVLYQMVDLYEEKFTQYEEIGRQFQYGCEENEIESIDYIWHYVFEFIRMGQEIDLTFFTRSDYQAALRQMRKHSYNAEKFFRLTEVLLEKNHEIIQKEINLKNIFLKVYRKDFDKEERLRYKEIIGRWIINSEELQKTIIEKTWLYDNLGSKFDENELEKMYQDIKRQNKEFEAEAKEKYEEIVDKIESGSGLESFSDILDEIEEWTRNYSYFLNEDRRNTFNDIIKLDIQSFCKDSWKDKKQLNLFFMKDKEYKRIEKIQKNMYLNSKEYQYHMEDIKEFFYKNYREVVFYAKGLKDEEFEQIISSLKMILFSNCYIDEDIRRRLIEILNEKNEQLERKKATEKRREKKNEIWKEEQKKKNEEPISLPNKDVEISKANKEEKEIIINEENSQKKAENKKQSSKQLKEEIPKWISYIHIIIMIDVLLYEGLQWLNRIFDIFTPIILWGFIVVGCSISVINEIKKQKEQQEVELIDIYESSVIIINIFMFATMAIVKIIGGLKVEGTLLIFITIVSVVLGVLFIKNEEKKKKIEADKSKEIERERG